MEQPLYHWDPVITLSGLTFYMGNVFQNGRTGSSSALSAVKCFDRIALNRKRVVSEEPMLVGQRVREVRIGPEVQFTC